MIKGVFPETVAGYVFRKGSRYRMPTHFGPAPGPRQRLEGGRYACTHTPKQTIVHAAFEAQADQLSGFLPPGFHLRKPYRIDVSFAYMTEIEWLAGRGYNTFGVSVPVSFRGEADQVDGDFLLVLWENMADPIITGREELGFSKVYCEIPPPLCTEDKITCRASWDDCQFAGLTLSGLQDVTPESLASPSCSEGLLHYKYMPRTGDVNETDACYAVFSPAAGSSLKVHQASRAETASCSFRRSTWEELPTLVHIVNALSDLSLGPCIEASVLYTRGAKDFSDQRIIK